MSSKHMNSESSALGPELVTKILQAINEGQAMAYRSLWDAGMVYLAEHWLVITLILLGIFVVAIIKASFGYWGMLGSVSYRFLFISIFLIIGFAWEPEIFASNYAKVGLALVGIFCYFMVGRMLGWTGLRRSY